MHCSLCLSNRPQFVEVGSKLPFCNAVCQKAFTLINAGEDDDNGKREREEDDYYREPMDEFSFRNINVDNLEHTMLMFDLETLYRARRAETIIQEIFLHPGFKLRYYNIHKAKILQEIEKQVNPNWEHPWVPQGDDNDYEASQLYPMFFWPFYEKIQFTPYMEFLPIALQQGDRTLGRPELFYFMWIKDWDAAYNALEILFDNDLLLSDDDEDILNFLIKHSNVAVLQRFNNLFEFEELLNDSLMMEDTFEDMQLIVARPDQKVLRDYLLNFCDADTTDIFYWRVVFVVPLDEFQRRTTDRYQPSLSDIHYRVPDDPNVISIVLDRARKISREELFFEMLQNFDFSDNVERAKGIRAFQRVIEHRQTEAQIISFCMEIAKNLHNSETKDMNKSLEMVYFYLLTKLMPLKQKTVVQLIPYFTNIFKSAQEPEDPMHPLEYFVLVVMTHMEVFNKQLSPYQRERLFAFINKKL